MDSKTIALALAAPNQAQAARVLGVDGKPFRTITRNVFGVHVSREDGGAWDERTRAFRIAYHVAQGNTDLRRAIVASFKAGKDAKPPTK